MDIFTLKEKVALIIGGTGKIGSYIAEAFAEKEAKVIVGARNIKDLEKLKKSFKKNNLDIEIISLDQSDEKNLKKCAEEIKRLYGTPEILVNSAVSRPMIKFFDDTVDKWDKSMEINARGLFLTTKIFGNEMAKQKKGSIINVSSIYGLQAPDMKIYEGSDFETEPDYPYNKGGMIAYSKYLASYFSTKNVRVNVIAPGGVFDNQNNIFLDKYISKVPLGRMANKEDFKGISIFLASDASSYITGTVIPLDGGLTIV